MHVMFCSLTLNEKKNKKNHNCISIQRFILQWAVQLQLYLQFLWWIFKGTCFPLWPRTITRTKTLNHTLELCSGKTMIGGGGEAGFGVGGETSLEKSRHTLMTSRKTRMASVSERSSTKRNAILTNECRNEALDLSFMYRSKGNTQISRETGEGW